MESQAWTWRRIVGTALAILGATAFTWGTWRGMAEPLGGSLESASAMFVGWTSLTIAMWVTPLPPVYGRGFARVVFVGGAFVHLFKLWQAWTRAA